MAAQPDKPVFCIDLLTYFDDFVAQPEFAVGFRDAVKKIAGSFSSGNVHYIDGRELLVDPAGLRTDLVHPGDIGMQEMGQNLAEFISRTV